MAARSDRREQRGHVVVEVLPGGRPRHPGPGPLPEGESLGHLPRTVPVAHAHHGRVQHVPGPDGARVGVQYGAARPAGADLRPAQLAGGQPAGGPAAGDGGVGEHGDQDRAQLVRQPPAPHMAEGSGLLVAGVHAHLHGGGGAHHGAAGGAGTVETGLHGVVARFAQKAAGSLPGVVTEAHEGQSVPAQHRADGVQVGGDGGDALHQGGGGRRAQLQLAAGLNGERRPQGHGAQSGVGRFEPFG